MVGSEHVGNGGSVNSLRSCSASPSLIPVSLDSAISTDLTMRYETFTADEWA
jgi:hypothetical protein